MSVWLIFTKRRGPTDDLQLRLPNGQELTLEGPKQPLSIPIDLVHFVAESTFNVRGFIRRVASGESPAQARAAHSDEDLQVEALVEALQSDCWGAATSDEQFIDLFKLTCAAHGAPLPPITLEQVRKARRELGLLAERWRAVAEDHTLRLCLEK